MAKQKTAVVFPRPHGNIAIERKVIDAGKRLFRIHPSVYSGNQFNNTAHGDARFSPVKDRITGNIIPTIYAGDSTDVAICEVVFHDVDVSQKEIVFEQKNLKDKSHTELELNDDVIVAVIDQVSVVTMRAGKKLIHCDAEEYIHTRAWAEHIYEQHKDIQGLEWPSRQHNGNAYVFFEDRITSGTLKINTTDTLAHDRATREKIVALAARMNIAIR